MTFYFQCEKKTVIFIIIFSKVIIYNNHFYSLYYITCIEGSTPASLMPVFSPLNAKASGRICGSSNSDVVKSFHIMYWESCCTRQCHQLVLSHRALNASPCWVSRFTEAMAGQGGCWSRPWPVIKNPKSRESCTNQALYIFIIIISTLQYHITHKLYKHTFTLQLPVYIYINQHEHDNMIL